MRTKRVGQEKDGHNCSLCECMSTKTISVGGRRRRRRRSGSNKRRKKKLQFVRTEFCLLFSFQVWFSIYYYSWYFLLFSPDIPHQRKFWHAQSMPGKELLEFSSWSGLLKRSCVSISRFMNAHTHAYLLPTTTNTTFLFSTIWSTGSSSINSTDRRR